MIQKRILKFLNISKIGINKKVVITLNNEIKTNFIKQFPIPKRNSNNPYIILFDAYTGMGKSTVSRLISKYNNAIILNNDEVRNFLNDYNNQSNLKDKLQKYRLEKLLQNNNNCIYDSCFCHNYETKLEYFKQLGYKIFIIRLECPDKIVEERLKKRKQDNINFSIADYNDYLWMKKKVKRVPLNLIDFTIDTSKNLENQVKNLIKFINKSK